ncbi:9045_t:CDS:1 [Diversispora eburnea]|uniref:9045_t:CDS:1 n=1 Tax=Diversispora eburnea TaxID=1213867 RepID=A0A9N9A1C3_9GLOM|nr:9045_t:CDS:1 [Diversispora eburnea]
MREKIILAIENYIDKHREKIKERVDKNVEKLKVTIIDKLPDQILEFIKKHSDDGDGHDTFMENVFQVISNIADRVSDDFKEDIRESTRERLDEATIDTSDRLTDKIIKESKNAVRDVTSKDDDGESWWSNIDLSFLRGGKEGIITKILELARPPIRKSGEEVNRKVSEKIPDNVKDKLCSKFGLTAKKDRQIQEEIHERGISLSKHGKEEDGHIISKFFNSLIHKGDDDGNKNEGARLNIIDKLFAKLPDKIQIFLEPHVKEFEERLIDHLNTELRENIFKDDNFLGGIKGILGKFGDKDGDGKNDLLEGVHNVVGSLFRKK